MSDLKGINIEISSLKEWIVQQQNKILRSPAEAEEELDRYIKEQQQEELKGKVARLRDLQQESERVVSMLRLVQPQFNKVDFDQEHERQEEERKIKQMFKEEEKERRRRILEAMEKRNAELSKSQTSKPEETPQPNTEIWDSIEGDEEELAKLGKRIKAQPAEAVAAESAKKEVKKYTVAARPASRDEETETGQDDTDGYNTYEVPGV